MADPKVTEGTETPGVVPAYEEKEKKSENKEVIAARYQISDCQQDK